MQRSILHRPHLQRIPCALGRRGGVRAAAVATSKRRKAVKVGSASWMHGWRCRNQSIIHTYIRRNARVGTNHPCRFAPTAT